MRRAIDERTRNRRGRVIGWWLLAIAGMVFAMVVLGGLTRLTDSGLSMVEWRPVTGWLPPLTHAAWDQAFRAYRAFPEYQKVNAGMTLTQFQEIFWLEYVHRLWGRLIGVAFALPLAFFLIRGWIERRLGLRLAGLFMLGGLQGVLGWYMVKSGLVDRPDVSQYRLVAHLGLALVIYGYALLLALSLLAPERPASPSRAAGRFAVAVAGAVLLTILAGGFVAGLDAGSAYNTFPLMDGELFPAELFAGDPAWRAPFEEVATSQFGHRLLAMLTVVSVLAFRWSLGTTLPARARLASGCLTVWVLVQFGLGVATLLSFVALPLAAVHQASALVLWSLALWCAYELGAGGIGEPATAPRADALRAAERAPA